MMRIHGLESEVKDREEQIRVRGREIENLRSRNNELIAKLEA